MVRLRALLVAVLVAAGPSAAAADEPPARSGLKGWLEDALSRALGGDVRFGRLDLDVTGLRAEFQDLALVVPGGDAPAVTAAARSGHVAFTWGAVAAMPAGRVRIAEIALDAPRIEIDAARLRARPKRATQRAIEVEIGRIAVEDGWLTYRDGDQRLALDVRGIVFDGRWDAYRRALEGPLRCAGAIVRPPIDKPLPFAARGRFRFSQRAFELIQFEAEGAGLSATFGGRGTLGAFPGFVGRGVVTGDVAGLGTWLDPGLPKMAGRIDGTFAIDRSETGALRVDGRARALDAAFGPLRAATVDTTYVFRPGQLTLAGLRARALGGEVEGEVTVALGAPPGFQTSLEGRGLDSAAVLALARLPIPAASKLTGRFAVEGNPGDPASWRGRADFAGTAASSPGGALPMTARGAVVFEDGRVRLDAPEVAVAAAALAVEIEASLRKDVPGGRVRLHGRTGDAAATQAGSLRILEALGVSLPAVAREPVEGSGALHADVALGPLASTHLEIALSDGSWSGEPFDAAALALTVGRTTVEIERLDARRGAASITGRAAFDAETGALLGVHARWEGLDALSVLDRLGGVREVTGTVAGFLDAERVDGRLEGAGEVVLAMGSAFGETIDEARAPLTVGDDLVLVPEFGARGPAFEASGSVRIDLAGQSVAMTLARGRLRAEALALAAGSGAGLAGEIDVEGNGGWSSGAGLSASLRWRSSALGLALPLEAGGALDLGPAEGTVAADGHRVRLTAAEAEAQAWAVDASLGLDADRRFDAVATVDALADEMRSADGAFGLRLAGRLEAHGSLDRPDEASATGSIASAAIRLGPRVVETIEPIPIVLADGRLEIGPARLLGEYSALEGALAHDLATGASRARLAGSVDLAVLSSLLPDLRASGSVDLDLTGERRADEATVTGTARVEDAALRLVGFPQPLEHVAIALDLDGRSARARYEGVLGGGEVRGEGEFRLGGAGIESFDAGITIGGATITFPEGFRGTYDGTLRATGPEGGTAIEGALVLARGLYTRDLDVASLAGGDELDAAVDVDESPADRVRLGVTITSDGGLWVRNTLAKIEARGKVVVGGTIARPALSGQMELFEGGTVRFRDVAYIVDSGTVDLADPARFNPTLDVRARTRVKSYDIVLRIAGPSDRLRYELTSTPALSEQDIVALLLTGSTIEEKSSAADARSMTTGLAADYFAGLLTSSRLGRDFQNALGLERFVIDPTILEGQTDPSARLTVGKRVGDRVQLVYSTDLTTSGEQIYQIEWEVSRKLRLRIDQEASEGLGGILAYADRFGGRRARGTAPGANAVADDRPRVDAVLVEGVEPAFAARLRAAVPLEAGERYARAAAYAGVDAIRSALVAAGYIEGTVQVEARAVVGAAPPGAVHVAYRVDPGTKVEVRVRAPSGRETRRQEKRLSRFWTESTFAPDLYVEAESVLRDGLRGRGFLAADVEHEHRETPSGATVVYRVDPGPSVRLAAIDFEGNRVLTRDRLEAHMLTRPDGVFRGGAFDERVLVEDLRAIRALYRKEGYLDVSVGAPVIRMSLQGDEVRVVIRIEEGPRYTLADVRVRAGTEIPAATLAAWAGLAAGDVFSPSALREAEERLRTRVDAAGYPDAVVASTYEAREGRADVTFRVDLGPRVHVDSISVTGNERTDDAVILRALALHPGDTLSRALLIEGQQALYRLGLFRRVLVKAAPARDGDLSGRVLHVEVEEAPPVGLTLGAGYDSEQGTQGNFTVSHDNIAGSGRTLALQGQVSGIDARAQIVGKYPQVFGRNLTGLTVLGWSTEEKDGFDIAEWSASVRVDWKRARSWTSFVRYNYTRQSLEEVSDALEVIREKVNDVGLADLGIAFTRDTRDDPFRPTRGGAATADLRLFARPLGSEEDFVKILLQGGVTKTMRRGSSYAAWMRLGAEAPFGGTLLVPISERFFAGGGTTMRGFDRDGVGPKLGDFAPPDTLSDDDADIAVGGESLFLLSQEWRFPIGRALRGVVFYDAGNVYFRLEDTDLTDLRHAAGLGVRVETPVGALRLEYGWKLDRQEGESPGEFHFAIGSAF